MRFKKKQSVLTVVTQTLFFGFFIFNFFLEPSFADTSSQNASFMRGKAVYERYCIGCHGVQGNGRGAYAAGLNPPPRDFTAGIFKWTGGQAGSLPSDTDLLMTITEGTHGTAMPSWQALREADRLDVIQYIKSFSNRFKEEVLSPELFIYPAPPITQSAVEEGKLLFEKMGCSTCHGVNGRGDGPSSHTLIDDWGNPILPANFSKGIFKTGQENWKIYRSVTNGVGGTPMPSFSEQLKPTEIWAVVYYIRSLKE
ncbi:MAG: c-type cytochrome [Nitrospirae bacterium]|nr:c-type cytochrome [Nitrospirota bacterium]MBI3351329.1 c-type cytochrome [Nitrospirota bacterium]